MTEIIEILYNLNLQVVQLVNEGNIKQALTIAQKAVRIARDEEFTQHPIYCNSLNNLAELYRQQGRFSEAKSILTEALDLRKEFLLYAQRDVAQSLNNLAALHLSQGDYDEAEKQYYQVMELWKGVFGGEHQYIATCLNNIAEVYREQGRYPESERFHLDALAMRKSLLGESSEVIQSLNNIASLYETQGRYQESEVMHLEALTIAKKILEQDHPDIAFNLNNLAALYDSQGRYSEAENNYLQSLEIFRKAFDEEHPHIAATLNNLGQVYSYQGRYIEAEQKHQESLAMRRNLFSVEYPDIAQSLSNLAEIYRKQGRYFLAKEICLDALAMNQLLFGEQHPEVANNLNNLAVIHAYQGEYQESEKVYLAALAMIINVLGEQHPDVASYLNNLAELYKKQGRYPEAERKYLEALEMRENTLGKEHPNIAITLNSIAELYRIQGRYTESEENFLKAYQIRKKALGYNHPVVAATLNSLAVLCDAQDNYVQAELFLKESLKINQNIYSSEHPDVATCINNLAVIYGYQGRYRESEVLHLEVLRIRINLLGQDHPDIANSLNNLAEIYYDCGRYSESYEKYLEVLAMRKRLLGDDHPDIARSLNNLATVLTAMGNYSQSLLYRIQASEINDKIINQLFSFSSENDRLAFLDKIRNNFHLFLSLICNHLSQSQTAIQQAFDFVIKRKALTANALASQNQALYSGKYPHLADKFNQLCDLSNQLIQLSLFIPSTSDSVTYQGHLKQIQSQYNNLQKQIASQVPEIQLFNQVPNRHIIAEKLPSDSVLIEFVRFDVFDFEAIGARGETQWHPSRYLAFILPVGKPDAVQMVDFGDAQAIDDLIQAFRLEASNNSEDTLGFTKKSTQIYKLKSIAYKSIAAIELSQALFNPIRDFVSSFKHLIFAPDGNLSLLPFELLPFDDNNARLLIDKYLISYLSVGRDVILTDLPSPREASVPLIITDPDFDLNSTELVSQTEQEFLYILGDEDLSRATATQFIGESLARKFENALLYSGSQALETHLNNNSCPRILVIATHGIFVPANNTPVTQTINPMMRSGLALAGANTKRKGGILPQSAGKGFILAQDIAGLDLRANQLTVLSACDTGRGDIKIGEGVFGLRRAFSIAGSKTLVMSLWEVPTQVTSLLMEQFFDNLQSGILCAMALQNAQKYIRDITIRELRCSELGLEILKKLLGVKHLTAQSQIDCDEDDMPLQHPFYWGAWICQGDAISILSDW